MVTPVARAERFRVGAGTVVSLLAGRSAYRLATLGTTILLLPIWGERRYGPYAAALASLSWLVVLVLTGPEKTVLKVLPRAPRTGRLVAGALLALLWWLPLPLAGLYVLAAALDAGGAAIYLGVAAMLVASGGTQLLIGLHRAHGRVRSDLYASLAIAAADLLLLAAAAAGLLGPLGFVGALIVIHTGLNILLTVTLGRPSWGLLRRPGLLRRLCWTALYLSGGELFVYGSTAILFALLAAAPAHAGQLGRLYVVMVVWSVGVNTAIYLLRVHAPGTALRLAGRAGTAGRARAARLAGLAAAANAVWLAGAVPAVLAVVSGDTGPAGQVLVWTVLLVTRSPMVGLLLWASFVLENTDATAPRVVGMAAVVGLATVFAAGLVAVPGMGGTGLIVAGAAGELGFATVVACGSRRRVPVGGGTGVSGCYAPAVDDARGFQIRPVAGRVTEAVAVLAASMGDGPVTRRHLPDPARRSRYQRALFTAAVRDVAAHGSAFVALDDTIRTGGATAPAGGGPAAVVGVVLALPPGRFPASPWRRLRMAPDLLRAASAARTSYPALLRSTVALRGTLPRSGSWWYLHTVAVHPGVRRRGVGTGLLRHVLGLVDETGLPCYVHAGSPAAAALYGRLGFTPVDAGAEVDGALMVRESPGSGVAP